MTNINPRVNIPEPVRNVDFSTEFRGINQREPKSLRSHPLGMGMLMVSGMSSVATIDPRESVIDYYNDSSFSTQDYILNVLQGSDHEARLNVFAKSMFHACSKNFISVHTKGRVTNPLVIYDSIETFNERNVYTEDTKAFKLSSVHQALAVKNCQELAEAILNVCGAMGMPYDAMQLLLGRKDLVYESFISTGGSKISNINGTNRGLALWVLHAIASQVCNGANSYVVDDVYYLNVNHQSQKGEFDNMLKDLGITEDVTLRLEGYLLVKESGKYMFCPDQLFVKTELEFLTMCSESGYWHDHPQELYAHVLQLAYVLNSTQEEFDVLLGTLMRLNDFAPDMDCTTGISPNNVHDLASHHTLTTELYRTEYQLHPSVRDMVYQFKNAVQDTLTRYEGMYNHKWYKGDDKFSYSRVQAKQRLRGLLLLIKRDEWSDASTVK